MEITEVREQYKLYFLFFLFCLKYYFFIYILFSLKKTEKIDFSWNPLADPMFIFHDRSLVEMVKAKNPEAQAFFRLLALCHTVMPEEKKEGESPPIFISIITT